MTVPHPRPPATPVPDFADPAVLRAHVADTMDFYHPRAIDPAGGFFHYFRDDGSVYDARHRHLVSSTRFVYDYAMAAREFRESPLAKEYLAAAEHGLRYLRDAHRDPGSGAYAWTPVQVGGTMQKPQEDLSGRLAVAAVGAVQQGVGNVINGAADLFRGFLNK